MPHILRVPQKQRGISSGGCGYVIAIIFERSDRDLCGPHPTACMGGPRRAPLTNARQRGINRSIGGPYYARGQLSLSSLHSRFLPSQRVFPNSTIDERHPSTATLTCIATPHDGSSSRVLFRQGHRAERRGWRCAEVCTITTTTTAPIVAAACANLTSCITSSDSSTRGQRPRAFRQQLLTADADRENGRKPPVTSRT